MENAKDEFVRRLQFPAAPEPLVHCELEDDTYFVNATQGADYWWDNLVGELRVLE